MIRKTLIALFVLCLPASADEMIEGVSPSQWQRAMAFCHANPGHQGCDALKSRYDVVAPKLGAHPSNKMTAAPATEDDLNEALSHSEHMSFSKAFRF